MGYFPVRYDSRVVNYDCRCFIRLATGQLGGRLCSDDSRIKYYQTAAMFLVG